MWKLLIGVALAAGTLLPATPAAAYDEGTWCLKASIGAGVVTERCHFRTFESCSAERNAWGASAFCVQNSRFLPYWQGRGIEQEPRQARIKKRRHH